MLTHFSLWVLSSAIGPVLSAGGTVTVEDAGLSCCSSGSGKPAGGSAPPRSICPSAGILLHSLKSWEGTASSLKRMRCHLHERDVFVNKAFPLVGGVAWLFLLTGNYTCTIMHQSRLSLLTSLLTSQLFQLFSASNPPLKHLDLHIFLPWLK